MLHASSDTFDGIPTLNDRLRLAQETGDPSSLTDGDIWYRHDLKEFMVRTDGITRGLITRSVVTLTDAATIAVDAADGNCFRVTLGGNRTLGAPSNPIDGQRILLEVIQDATGSRTLAYNSVYAFGTDVVSPTLTTTASKRDFIGFIYNSTANKWYCLAVAKGY